LIQQAGQLLAGISPTTLLEILEDKWRETAALLLPNSSNGSNSSAWPQQHAELLDFLLLKYSSTDKTVWQRASCLAALFRIAANHCKKTENFEEQIKWQDRARVFTFTRVEVRKKTR